MKFDDAAKRLEGIPYTSPAKGRIFYDLVKERRPKKILELGFAHGVSACYFGAAAQEIGDCDVTAVDLESARGVDPSIESLIAKCGLQGVITPHRESSSYTWFLKKEIEAQTRDGACQPKYDLIFIDGPKDWTNDGCAFFLADKLLKPNGVILFDDYAWSYREDERSRGKHHDHGYIFASMSEEEFATPHVKAIFELLVLPHPAYGKFEILDDTMALAEKTATVGAKQMRIETRRSIRYRLLSRLRKLVATAR